jgi:hypothetical protein
MKSNATQIASLIRAGVIKPTELTTLKMALVNHSKTGDIGRLPKNQRMVLDKFQTALSSAALATTPTFYSVQRNIAEESEFEVSRTEFVTEAITKDPPMVLVLKRKAIRLFPDGKRVALYHNESLGVTISVPYEPTGQQAPVAGLAEETEVLSENIKIIKSVSDHGEPQVIRFKNGQQHKVSPIEAKHIMTVYSALNPGNQQAVEKMLSHSPKHFKKFLDFAHSKTAYGVSKE